MKKIKLFIILLLLAVVNFNATAQNSGDNDHDFNPGQGADSNIYASAIQSDGKIIIVGDLSKYNSVARNKIVRLNAGGGIDLTFNSGTGANDKIQAVAIQSDGKIIIGGLFTSYNGIARNRIARINSDGSLDSSFDTGLGVIGHVYSIAIQSDGKIIIGGSFSSYNGTARNNIARLNINGSIDIAFDPGSGTDFFVFQVAIQSDGKILIGGLFSYFNSTARKRIARLNTNGSLDITFDPGSGADQNVLTIAIQSDGKIVIGGNFTSYNGIGRNRIARLNSNGSLDLTFDPGSGIVDQGISTIAIQSDGQIIIAGKFSTYNGINSKNVARLNSDGSLDVTFSSGNGNGGTNATIFTSIIQPDGKIFIGGDFYVYNGIVRNRIARINSDGSLDSSFNPGSGADDVIKSIAIQSDEKIIIAGQFSFYNGTFPISLARLNTDGTRDTTFNQGIGVNGSLSFVDIQSDGRIIIGGSFDYYNGTPINYIARLNIDGSLDSSFDPGTGASSGTVDIQSDSKIIIGGNFTSFNGTLINRIARLNTDGSLDTSFNVGTGANDWLTIVALQPDGKIIIGGNFTSFNGTLINRIARLNTDGSLDTSFNVGIGANNSIYPITLQPDGKIIIGGNFTSFNGASINRIARLNADGSLDTAFNVGTGANNSVATIALQPDGKIIISGGFTSYNGIARNRIARLNENGSLDLTFDSGTGANNFIFTSALQFDGKLIIGGAFTTYNGIGRNRIARILNCNVSTGADVQFACDSYNWIDGNTYTSSTNIPTFTLTNVAGCDSIVTLNLTINNSTSSSDVITACDSITWIDGNTYTVSTNTPTYVLTNEVGCDSIVTLNLTINNSTSSTDIVTACDSITWIDGITYTSSTTTPTFTFVGGSSTGCDSIVTLNLTISPIDISVVSTPFTIVAMESGATYQWLDCNNGNAIISGEINQSYIPASSGNYAVVVSKNGCVDTSACINFCNIDANYLFNDNGNGNYTFTNATSGNYTQSHWAFGDGTTSTATNPNHTFTVNNTFAVVLTVNDSTTVSSCMDYYIDVITVTGVVSPLQCAAGFTMYADTNNINVILNATGTNLTYLWDFGDGNTSNAQFPTHTYATTGNYYLCLTIDDGAGCVDMYCDSIGENGVVFNKQTGFTINVIAPPLATQVNEQVTLTSGVVIYPNPTTAEFIIELASFSPKTQLSIVSVEGKTVYTNNTINTNKIVINAADWSKGIYMVKITDKQSSKVVKLIKQ